MKAMRKIENRKRVMSKWLIAGAICLAWTYPMASFADIQFTQANTASGIPTDDGGITWLDYNNDGLQDIYTAGRLFKNVGSGQFTEETSTSPDLSALGGVVVGDYDGDGCDDIFATGVGMNALLRNNSCDPDYNEGAAIFTNATVSAGLQNEAKRGMAAAFADVNGDGFLDLYVANWSCNTVPRTVESNDLYINDGDGTFTRRSVPDTDDLGCAWATSMSDYDQDGDIDIIIANDTFFCDSNPTVVCTSPPSEIYRNRLKEDGVFGFEPVGFDVRIAAMGVAIGDYNNDLNLDIYQTAIGPGTLTTGNGSANFTAEDSQKLLDPNRPAIQRIGWGASFADVDNDGDADLLRANTSEGMGFGAGSNELFVNNGDGTFAESSNSTGIAGFSAQRLAVADYDNDGDMDMIVGGTSLGNNLYRNDSTTSNHWVKILLGGKNPNHRGVGARVTVTSYESNDMSGTISSQIQEVRAGTSVGSTEDLRPHFGLGVDDIISDVTVTWPSGCVQQITSAALDSTLQVDEASCTNISGQLLTNAGDPLPGIHVRIISATGNEFIETTDCDGSYRAPLAPTSYYVQAITPGYQYNPFGHFLRLDLGVDSSASFTATPDLPRVSGTIVSDSGKPLAGVTVRLTTLAGMTEDSGVTDCRGDYRVPLTPDTYFIQAISNDEYTFTNGQLIFVGPSSDLDKDYVGTPTP